MDAAVAAEAHNATTVACDGGECAVPLFEDTVGRRRRPKECLLLIGQLRARVALRPAGDLHNGEARCLRAHREDVDLVRGDDRAHLLDELTGALAVGHRHLRLAAQRIAAKHCIALGAPLECTWQLRRVHLDCEQRRPRRRDLRVDEPWQESADHRVQLLVVGVDQLEEDALGKVEQLGDPTRQVLQSDLVPDQVFAGKLEGLLAELREAEQDVDCTRRRSYTTHASGATLVEPSEPLGCAHQQPHLCLEPPVLRTRNDLREHRCELPRCDIAIGVVGDESLDRGWQRVDHLVLQHQCEILLALDHKLEACAKLWRILAELALHACRVQPTAAVSQRGHQGATSTAHKLCCWRGRLSSVGEAGMGL
mmetsp:Transcript_40589/g.135246  ORF Transcript_40589/g.135246 Transcript_40589/m.135246 type:complete len:366 (+) Transcript_40589:2146-3243(+)